MFAVRLKRSLRAISPLLATIILIAIVVGAGVVVYGLISGWMGTLGSTLAVQPVSTDLLVAGDKALLTASVKNTGNKPLAGIVVAGYDDNGKCFKLALPPADPGQASGNTLIIPLGVSNIVLDGSGNNNHGTIYGAKWVDGIYGKALSFDGTSSSYVEVPHSAVFDLNQLSIAFWIKTPTSMGQTWRHVVGKTIPLGRDYGVWMYSADLVKVTGLHQYSTVFGSWVASITPFEPNTWHHIVLTIGLTGLQKFYADGAFIKSYQGTSGTANRVEPVTVGKSDNYWNGLIDEVRFYSQVLTDAEVAFSSANPSLPITRGLVLWLPFDEGSSAPFSFTAGNRYALTITVYSLDGSVATQTLTVTASA